MLDPVGILIVTIISALMSLGILGSMLRARIPGVRDWVLGCGLSVLSLLLIGTQIYDWPRVLNVIVANQLLMLGLLIILQGCRKFACVRAVYGVEYLVWLLALVGLWYWTYPVQDVNARIAIISGFHAYVYLSVAWICYRMRPDGHFTYAYRFVCCAALAGGLAHAVRGILHGVGWTRQSQLLESSPSMTFFFGLGIVALPCLAAGMAMLVHERLVRRLEHIASVDELTGALMRRAFLLEAERALRVATRTGRPLSLAMLDLDRFKSINDSRGHAIGDRVLQHFGSRLGGSLRASDIFGRLGGEEFIIICPETEQADGVRMLARMRQLIQSSPCLIDGEVLPYTFSAGIGVFQPGESLTELMARVDEVLYVAKSRGRDCIVEAPPRWRQAGGVSQRVRRGLAADRHIA